MMQNAIFALLIGCALSANEVNVNVNHNEGEIKAMEEIFARSEGVHKASMVAITATLSLTGAVELLKKANLTSPEMALVTDIASRKNLRQPLVGYAGLDGARKLLNSMIYESLSKYDTEIAKCTDFYSKQCAAMEVCRGQISASNFIAANSRTLILDAQSTINRCEVDIPARKYELKQHNLKCKHELQKLNTRLKIVSGDIQVITMILTMTDCDANKKLLQEGKFAPAYQQQLALLKSEVAHNALHETFSEAVDGIEGSSWAWLAYNKSSRKLEIRTTNNNGFTID